MKTLCLAAILLAALTLPAAETQTAAPAPYPQRQQWWGDARFGLFIHWGPVSLKGTEIGWSRGGERRGYGSTGTEVPAEVYDNLYREFNPTNFNADEWVALAKAAGMKYLVFTSRHHDGFSMFDTQASDYKITSPNSPFRRDVVKELADACHRGGLRFGLYYSPPDWHHPGAFTPDRHTNYLAYLKAQVRELLTRYGPVDILWFDGLGKSAKDYDGVAMNQMIRELQPGILINNRIGLAEDFDTPEQTIGKFQINRPWESCITICNQWAWKPDDTMKSLKQCLDTLIRCAGGDGNLLFNVGPMPDGRIEPRQVERLREMGAWLAKHGESIYGTRGGPWKPTQSIASTREGNTIFLHLLRSEDGRVELPDLPVRIQSASLPGGGKVEVSQQSGRLTVTLPKASLDPIDTIVRLELDRTALDIPVLAPASGIKGAASNVYQKQNDEYGPQEAFDSDAQTRWATDGGTRRAWISADFGKPKTIERVRIEEVFGRVTRFELQARVGETWKTVFTGEKIGSGFQVKFDAVTAQEFRLNILDATDGPTIAEIDLLEK